jgi:hypothetical protein
MSTIRLPRLHIAALHGAAALAAILTVGLSNGALAQTPTKAQQSAIRSACSTDYRSYCASVPPGGKPALDCLQQNAAKLSDACRGAVQAAGGSAAATPDAAATTAGKPAADGAKSTAAPAAKSAPAAPAAPAAAALTPRQELALVRQSCAADVRTHCRGVPIGGGNVVACLKANAASLSSRCQSALAPLAR